MFSSFKQFEITIGATCLRGRMSTDQNLPPLLLLHGHPESHMMWHRVAPALSAMFSIVAPDLRGYGDSSRPKPSPDHSNHSKRAMAADGVALMEQLGHDKFFVAGHDRGARVAARMAADFPERVMKAALLDVAPTLDMYEATDWAFATEYWHWFTLIQKSPLPETLIGGNPRAYVEGIMGNRHAGLSPFPPEILDHYIAGFTGMERAQGVCEDYRAAATIDLEHDRADRAQGRLIQPPLRVLWARYGTIERHFKPLELWGAISSQVTGRALDCGHYLPEERPDEVVDEFRRFFTADPA